MSKTGLIFLRGLNTRPKDRIYWGPLDLGPTAYHLQKAFKKRGIPFESVPNLGRGGLEEQRNICKDFIAQKNYSRFFLLGHSQGGLVARTLSFDHELKSKICGLLTVATPHHGSKLADFALNIKQDNPILYSTLKLMNYDTEARHSLFLNLSTKNLVSWNKQYPLQSEISNLSISCSMKNSELPLSLKLFPRLMKTKDKTDGMVEHSSQIWGQHIAHLPLDHISQLGYFTHLKPSSRLNSRRVFTDMINLIADTYEKYI